MWKHLQKVVCFILFFIYSRAVNNKVICNGNSCWCNDTFTDVRFTSLLAKNIRRILIVFMLLESAFNWLFCLKFWFKLITFSNSYARKEKWLFFLNTFNKLWQSFFCFTTCSMMLRFSVSDSSKDFLISAPCDFRNSCSSTTKCHVNLFVYNNNNNNSVKICIVLITVGGSRLRAGVYDHKMLSRPLFFTRPRLIPVGLWNRPCQNVPIPGGYACCADWLVFLFLYWYTNSGISPPPQKKIK